MMKIKSLLLAILTVMAGVSFTACSDDDNNGTDDNYTTYQKAVDAQVQAGKKHSKVILLVAFGSTWQNAFDAFDATKEAYEAKFPNYDVYVSYSSAICINRAAAGEHKADGAETRNYYAPNFWLHAFGTAKYDEIVVQSLQVIPGEEFTRVINYLKDFGNNSLGDLDDDYLSKVVLKLGTPLLDTQDDVQSVAQALNGQYSSYAKQGMVAFMGHGNPNNYDTYSANVRYTQLETALQELNKNYFVGTVDMPENYKQNVWDRMQTAGITSGKVYLHPLMSIAGDHAHNDMAGQGDEYWDASDPASEENSWYEYFTHKGYTITDDQIIMKGLLEVVPVRAIWMQHTSDAVNGEPLDGYYHSKNPEVE